jgi:hypothetical protein
MADRRRARDSRFEATHRDDWRRLSASLRGEARDERPRFSRALHGGVLAALAAKPIGLHAVEPVRGVAAGDEPPASRPPRRSAWAREAGGIAAVAACLVILVVTARPRPAPPVAATVTAGAGIERLPTPDEIGATVFAHVATFAALAVGVPELPELVAFDPNPLATTDDLPP